MALEDLSEDSFENPCFISVVFSTGITTGITTACQILGDPRVLSNSRVLETLSLPTEETASRWRKKKVEPAVWEQWVIQIMNENWMQNPPPPPDVIQSRKQKASLPSNRSTSYAQLWTDPSGCQQQIRPSFTDHICAL